MRKFEIGNSLLPGIVLTSLLQVILFFLAGRSDLYEVFALVLAGSTFLSVHRYWRTKSTLAWITLMILYCAQVILYFTELAGIQDLFKPRLLWVALALLHATMVLLLILTAFGILRSKKLLALILSSAAFLFVCEMSLEILLPHSPLRPMEWMNLVDPVIYHDGPMLRKFYPDDPRNYFHKAGIKENVWLRVGTENSAELLFPANRGASIRINIKKATSKYPFDIQLNLPYLKVKGQQKYLLQFKARADSPRNIFAGLAQSHPPWDGLGGYHEFSLTSVWKEFQKSFSATADDDNARIVFDAGNSPVSFEVSSVILREKNGPIIEANPPSGKYFVEYRFNTQGCRGREYDVPRPDGLERILFLGDSYTFGLGVHEEHTFASVLERSLNKTQGTRKYDVINCGVGGYSTREERLFYQIFGAKYQPTLVVLVMTWNDASQYFRRMQNAPAFRPKSIDLLFYSWAKFKGRRYPKPNFSNTVSEALELHSELKKDGIPMAVVLFREDSDYAGLTYHGKIWNDLSKSISKGLQADGIPVLDLGKAFFPAKSEEDLLIDPIQYPFPNRIAHEMASQQILTGLTKHGLVKIPQ